MVENEIEVHTQPICSECGVSFVQSQIYGDMQRVPVCGESYTTKQSIGSHMSSVHHGMTYDCSVWEFCL